MQARFSALKDIAERTAREIHVSPHAPIRRYFSAASSMLRQGRTYLSECAWEQAFLLHAMDADGLVYEHHLSCACPC